MTNNSFTPLVIDDFDFINFKKDEIEQLKNGLNTTNIVHLRNQKISMSQQIEFTALFGRVEFVWEDKHPESEYIQLLQNKVKKYEPFKSTSQHWHTDRSFMNFASKYTFLYAVEIGNGCGGTEFCNLYQAYQDLDHDYKKTLSVLNGLHAFKYKFPDLMRRKLYPEDEIEYLISKYPDVLKPIVKTNYVSKKKSLFLSELCLEKIVELTEAESRKTLDFLYGHALSSKYRHIHNWKEGDVLIWDNESLMHRGLPSPSGVKRVFHRTTTMGEIS